MRQTHWAKGFPGFWIKFSLSGVLNRDKVLSSATDSRPVVGIHAVAMDPLQRLADEVGMIGRRLEQVSAELRGYQQNQAAAVTVAPPIMEPAIPAPPMQTVAPAPPFPAFPGPAMPPKPSLFERLGKDGAGSRLLAWVGGAVTLLGVVLLLVLAVQRGWLGPVPRVLVGAALGGALVGIGLWVHRSPTGRTGAFALAATGFATLYLDAVAATTLFELLPSLAGLGAGLAIVATGLFLAARWGEEFLGTAVVVGCVVCAPMITQGFTPLLVTFLLTVQIATMPVQLRRNWPTVALVAGLAPLLASLVSTANNTADPMTNALVALLAMGVGVGLALISAMRKADDQAALVLLVLAAGPALFSTIVLTKAQAVTVAGAVTGVMLTVWLTSKYWPGKVGSMAGAATLIAAFQTTATAFDGTARSTLLMGEAALLALVALWLRNRVALTGSVWFGVAGAALACINDVQPSLLVSEPDGLVKGDLAAALLASSLIVVVAVLLPLVASRTGRLQPPSKSLAPWLFAGVAALYGAAGVVLSGALSIAPDRSGFLLGHVVVTVSWTVAALVLLLRGIGVLPLRVTGLVLVGAAVVKLVLFDLSTLDGLARVAAFLCAGLILLAAGTRYAKLVARVESNS
jgi:uncharacterized membrane protein